ncbi:MAG: UDP-3-O-(3-hydroxymyristoyl)glucosamine N-acyltransferase [Caldimonas sp.]
MPVVALREIAEQLGGDLVGDAALRIDRIGPLDSATPSTISFLANPRLRTHLATTQAGCVIVTPADRETAVARGNAIVTADPYHYYARLTQWWARRLRPPSVPSIHPSAVIAPGAQIAADASIGALAVIEAGAVVGAGAEIGPHCVLGTGAQVGAGTRLAARVTIGADCSIGERCILHSGVVIGADGFGFAPVEGRWEKIEQLGSVRIGNDVEIGANTCIDRGALDDTILDDGVKLDNLIQIGHNVKIGAHTAIAGCAAVAGSTTIGAHCMIGGAAMITGHIRIADGVTVSGATAVLRSIDKPGVYSGIFPIDENATWEKNAATLRQLHSLRDRLRKLEKNATGSATT